MNKPKVFLAGGDGIGWALDEDLELTRRALQDVVEFTGIDEAEVIHSVWWEPLLALPAERLVGRRIICHMSGEPLRYLGMPGFSAVRGNVGLWIAQTTEAYEQLSAMGMPTVAIPYTVNTDIFRPMAQHDSALRHMRLQWDIPLDRYLIGNFHRDTEGRDLVSPKLVKGPDIFAEIIAGLTRTGLPVHVVLAGPRRTWLRRRLEELGISYTYVGHPCAGDDITVNRLSREDLNLLYNILDLCLVSSRSEGGPRSILESVAAECPVISTPVGLAHDILPGTAIYTDAGAAIDIILADIRRRELKAGVGDLRERVLARHTTAAVAPLFTQVYRAITDVNPAQPVRPSKNSRQGGLWKYIRKSAAAITGVERLNIGIWHNFVPPPYGGGNQFMTALRGQLLRQGVNVLENRLSSAIDAYILNSVQFDIERFTKFSRQRLLKVLHRIDGPIQLIRGFDREKDDLCFQLNQRFAAATVIQSDWTYRRLIELGYRPVHPVIIRNAVDAGIFHSQGRTSFDPNRKVRLISSSWSDNPRKGGAIYRWIDEHLDWDRYDYTFVGRTAEEFHRIKKVDPVPSGDLAELLRQHDIFITASRNDPCSNAVIEALACGLPVLYLNDGGHPELVGYGGLPFNDQDEILPQLERLVGNYSMYQHLIAIPTMEEVAAKYLSLLRDIVDSF